MNAYLKSLISNTYIIGLLFIITVDAVGLLFNVNKPFFILVVGVIHGWYLFSVVHTYKTKNSNPNQMFDLIHNGIATFNHKGEIITLNEKATEILLADSDDHNNAFSNWG